MKLIESTYAKVLLAVIAIIFAIGMLSFQETPKAQGEAFTGSAAFLKSQATTSVGTTAETIFASNSNCKSRIITTRGANINIVFGDKDTTLSTSTVSASAGHTQNSSTTVAYDSGIYGCGEWAVYSLATQVLTISEF